MEELQSRVRAADPWCGRLRPGSSDLFAMTCLLAVLSALERRHRELDVNLVATSSVALQRRDAGYSRRGAARGPAR